jgi:hypothetical protein
MSSHFFVVSGSRHVPDPRVMMQNNLIAAATTASAVGRGVFILVVSSCARSTLRGLFWWYNLGLMAVRIYSFALSMVEKFLFCWQQRLS